MASPGNGGEGFGELGCLAPETLAVLDGLNFTHAMPVQTATIPLFLKHKDVAVDACTGSGKTLAFVIPVIEILRRLEEPLRKHQVGAVIVSPTRELAKQIYTVAEPFIASLPWLRAALLLGGSDLAQDISRLREHGANLLVGTPGRLDDIRRNCAAWLELKTVEVLILDEADQLLGMGYKQQLDSLIAALPRQRRTGLFSATQTEAVKELARAGLRNAVRVNVAVTRAAGGAVLAGAAPRQEESLEQRTPDGLAIAYQMVAAGDKPAALAAFLQEHRSEKVIVYFLTCACVDWVARALPLLLPPGGGGVKLHAMHGKMKQSVREATLAEFAGATSGVLLCTDVAARGLDIPDVQWILQADPPQDPAAFVHRVGRTARMGRSGNALVFLMPHEDSYVEFLRRRKVPIVEQKAGEPYDGAAARAAVRRGAETDRAMMEASVKAFITFIRGYKEHQCNLILRLQELPLGQLASAFGMLHLPRMPEIKKGKNRLDGFEPSSVDPDTVRFKDKAREKQRQAMLRKKQAEEAAGATAVEQGKPADKPAAAAPAVAGARLTASKRRVLEAQDEREELAREYALLKRLKKGKISQHEFDVALGVSDDSGAEDDAPKGQLAQAMEARALKLQRKQKKQRRKQMQRLLTAG